MTRAPSAGKTRLARHVAPQRLEALRAALLGDTLEVVDRARAGGDEAVVFFTPVDSDAEIAASTPSDVARVPQPAGDLGQRMRAAFEDLLIARRCDVALLIGADIPFLAVEAIVEARDELRARGGVVFGPAEDGGYYLIGMSQVHVALFEGIEWGTSRVLTETMQIAARRGIDARLVRGAFDVDTIEDLRRLEQEIVLAPAAVAPRVRSWFSQA